MNRTIAAVTAVTLFFAPFGQAWACRFSGSEIEELITNMYGYYNGTVPSDLRDVDRNEYAQVVADNIGCLDPGPFNEVLGHLAANYGTVPTDRPAIEHIMRTTHDTVLPVLQGYRDHSVFWTFVDDTFAVFTVVYMFRFALRNPTRVVEGAAGAERVASGFFRSGGRGLSWYRKFQEAAYVAKMQRFSRPWLATLGAGLAVGAIDNLYAVLSTHKMDPNEILHDAQRGVVGRHQESMAAVLADVRLITSDVIRADPRGIESRLTQYERTTLDTEQELNHIREVSADLNGMAETARMDIASIKRRLRDLWDQTDSALLGAGPSDAGSNGSDSGDDGGMCYPDDETTSGGEYDSSDPNGVCVAPELP